ncbi:TetR/AcrR family transcriptional regulator [Enterovirga rhinocerotis]|uniref:TetR/AcrR family transcriptional regulator n=1 Tax=Enterovirga rhinocerotis TaxID=1339210 RepID=UPI00315D156D
MRRRHLNDRRRRRGDAALSLLDGALKVLASPRRKKQPELVRRALIDCAAKLALEQGLAAVTVQAVCEAAGVTKGALFHHFANKQALIEGVVGDLMEQMGSNIDAAMADDPEPRGRYTRAYVKVVLDDLMLNHGSQWTALYVSTLAAPSLRRMTGEWLARSIERHRATDDEPHLQVARLAADGAWLAALLRDDGGPMPDLSALRERLVAMTRKI